MTINNRYGPIHLGSPGEDISKKDLHAVIQRFKNLNQLRLQRVQDFLQPRQQVFLPLLPLLFHRNHPLLPGFINSETTAGIPDYTPNKQSIQIAKQFSKGFSYKRRALVNYPIEGIFLMGSVGSIAFSKTSDMDIWLCHQADLTAAELDELQQKATAIEKWAASYELEVHFFLVNSQQFSLGKTNPISFESSGDTQHYLLLEEFYRTAIFIAGRIPAWWLVPPHQEYNYSSYITHLLENRFISNNEVIDFGGLASIPAEEFITATLWHIYKSIDSPHKSLLKLFLMECYASEYPKPQWLCFDLKTAIYQGTVNIDQFDPYFLIYEKVEHYLTAIDSLPRLNLARQCFYLKIMGDTSSKSLDIQSRIFRENYMQSIAENWNWPEDLLPALKKQKFWDIHKASEEHTLIRKQLKQCLRMILELAGNYVDYNYRENKDLKLIGRKLYAFLEKKPHKIEIITTRSSVHTKETTLSIIEFSNSKEHSVWRLYSGTFNNKKLSSNILLKQDNSFLGILCWLVINGLYHDQLHLHFSAKSLSLKTAELHLILNKVFQFLSSRFQTKPSSLDVYNKADKLLASLIFINLGQPLISEREDGILILSERSDPLSYGKDRQCFIQQMDQVSISCWGEVTTYQHCGIDGFFNCLTTLFNTSEQPFSKKAIEITCTTPTRAQSILLRTDSVINNLIQFFARSPSEPSNNRYFLIGENSTYVLQKQNNRLQYCFLNSTEQVLQELSLPQVSFSKIHFDPLTLEKSLIPAIYKYNQKQVIQVFYFSENKQASIFIIDEKGSLFTQIHQQSDNNQVLNNYALFIESIVKHPVYESDIKINFFEIQKNTAGHHSIHPAKWTPPKSSMDFPIRVIIEETVTPSQNTNYCIYCNDIEFNSSHYGDKLFKEVANYILDCRSNSDNYPVHITDIEAPASHLNAENESQLQMIHYLNLKKQLEAKIIQN